MNIRNEIHKAYQEEKGNAISGKFPPSYPENWVIETAERTFSDGLNPLYDLIDEFKSRGEESKDYATKATYGDAALSLLQVLEKIACAEASYAPDNTKNT